MLSCPNCVAPLALENEAAYGALPRTIDVGVCAACSLMWFEGPGSTRLTPGAVLALLAVIGNAGASRNALASNLRCPRCQAALAFTHDVQRATRFTYWRCPNDRGQLMTFAQFLAEKNFIRAPSTQELERLRSMVRQIRCSQCGAPIDLANESACAHCGAPVAVIDPAAVANAVRELAAADTAAPNTPVPDGARISLSDAQLDALLEAARRDPEAAGGHDLLAIGAAAMGFVVHGWLSSR